MTTGDGTGISGRDWYGDAIWAVFESVHPELERHFAEMTDAGASDGKSTGGIDPKKPDLR
jgi:hypothetical protein